jgi:hypothetical protein
MLATSVSCIKHCLETELEDNMKDSPFHNADAFAIVGRWTNIIAGVWLPGESQASLTGGPLHTSHIMHDCQ